MKASQALALLAVDPVGLGGAVLHGAAGPRREALLREFDALIPATWPRRRIPVGIAADRLHGGLDLAGTLAAGRPVFEAGLLSAARGGVITLPMSERASATIVTGLLGLLDGDGGRGGAALLALDESLPDEASTPSALRERVAFWLEVDAADPEHQADAADLGTAPPSWRSEHGEAMEAARARLGTVTVPAEAVRALCEAALALGTGSTRGEQFALRAARAAAALDGRDAVNDDDLSLAAALVLGPRATRVPAPPEAPPPEPPPPEDSTEQAEQSEPQQQQLPDRILAAVTAVLPPELLAGLTQQGTGQASGKGAPAAKTLTHGHRVGARPGDPRQGARLDIVETLRAAAPWQRIRNRRAGRLAVRKDDFRIQRLLHRTGSTVIIAVDASGSSALQRLGEAKGAVELLLAESYVRRDRVALISFRGTKAELILPPTRSLARARRTLAGLPGGGGTPLAAAFAEGERLARQVARERDGGTTLFVVLTDARANVGLDGTGGRPKAEADAEQAAKSLRLAGVPSVFIDTSPRPSQFAAQLARAMGATYVALPVVDAHKVCAAVRGVTAAMERSA